MEIHVHPGPTCPKCGSAETLKGGTVRPFKVWVDDSLGWESHCTACDIWFVDDIVTEYMEGGKRYRIDLDNSQL